MSSLKIVLWNGSGIRASAQSTKQKLDFFAKEYTNYSFTVAAFVETHLKQGDVLPKQIKLFSTAYHIVNEPTPPNESHAGILVLIHKDFTITQSSVIQSGRILCIKIEHSTSRKIFNIVTVYGTPNQRMSKSDIDAFCTNVTSCLDPLEPNVILGDFNFVDSPLDRQAVIGSYEKPFIIPWSQVLTNTQTVDAYRVQYPTKRVYSFVSKQGRSRLDRAYVSKDIVRTVVRQRYTRTPFTMAHKIYSLELIGEQEIGPTYWKFNTTFLQDAHYTRLVQDTINNLDDVPNLDPKAWWRIFLRCIKSKSLAYGIQKKRIEREIKTKIQQEIDQLETDDEITEEKDERCRLLYQRLKDIEFKEIEGYRIRIKGLPTYEQKEPDIAFYSNLEKSRKKKSVINSLIDKDGGEHSTRDSLLGIVEDFYTLLFSPSKVNPTTQVKLLKNIKTKVSTAHRDLLDAPFTKDEIRIAVKDMQANKSPGLDGLPAEFYQTYWHLLGDKYFNYIRLVQKENLDPWKNKSVTTLLYKDKGEVNDLANYRPISLINVDVKIITKVLANRLKPILPTIIHKTQTAIDTRRINHTVHMIRDLIDYTNEHDIGACFLFIDQEKAFDRVDHAFLFKVMESFGIGPTFINWLKMIYSNASMTVKVNGFLTKDIPVRRGVRQGDPLSFYAYIFVNEILSLQLRTNENIVGFQVGGERIISMHYADDTTIAILQNRCFKEVFKELEFYEQATGAKINMKKTKGLWLGSWKSRKDSPVPITFTNTNVKTLGIYVGNADPASQTFEEIATKMNKTLNYWKPFRLNKFAKARVIEIFHASKLWYAANFYPIPADILKRLSDDMWSFINYPSNKITVARATAIKLRCDGGLKLVDIQTKSVASKVHWLMELVSDQSLKINLKVATLLLGMQKGDIKGKDLFFTPTFYVQLHLKTSSCFYKEAIKGLSMLETRKKICHNSTEHLFYNQAIRVRETNKVLIFQNNANIDTTKLAPILEAYENMIHGCPFTRRYSNLYTRLDLRLLANTKDYLLIIDNKSHAFQTVPLKLLYTSLLQLKPSYKDHCSRAKWQELSLIPLDWQKIWQTVHNTLASECTKSAIWEQLHLNFYTQYNFNKWHSAALPCSFCTKLPEDVFHVILNCPFVKVLWNDLHPLLERIHAAPITEYEMAFGLFGTTPPILLRNWLTFILRELVEKQEKRAYYNPGVCQNLRQFKIVYNQRVEKFLHRALLIYESNGDVEKFLTSFGCGNVIISPDDDGSVTVHKPFNID